MLTCGVNLTHDGGLALLDGNRLVFSLEIEKLGNNSRHAELEDLGVIFSTLRRYGYAPSEVDTFVFDGWRRTRLRRRWGGQPLGLELAPYRRGLVNDDLLYPIHASLLDLGYVGYTHYAGHVAAAYCTSPFASGQEPAYVLCWDGAMFPFLYHYDPSSGTMRNVGPLFYMLGDTYHTLCQAFPPFDAAVSWPDVLSLPGKIMAYVAKGVPDPEGLRRLKLLYEDARREAFGDREPHDEELLGSAGRRILGSMRATLVLPGLAAEDALATVHAFLGRMLLRHLVRVIDRDGRETPNLCLSGGCALNIKWNAAVRDSGICDNVWVPPFPNDSGSAIGTACCHLLASSSTRHIDWTVYSGPDFVGGTPLHGWRAQPCLLDRLAAYLDQAGEPVLFLGGPAELGPRALGSRSIIAPAGDARMKDRLNRIKDREGYRPVAPVCLEEFAADVFTPGLADPFMLFEQEVRPEWRPRVPAVCHLDGTARVQTVGPADHPRLYELLAAYHARTGIPVLCNTSANLHGRGFFPDLESAMRWGRVGAIWFDGSLYQRVAA